MPKIKTLAFTGIRPNKLPWGFNESHPACLSLKIVLRERLVRLIEDESVRHFISGMAMGIDQICAEIVLELQVKYPDITLEAAIPCKEQDKLWPQEYRVRYRIVLEKCAYIHAVSEEYTDDCMEKRNRYMADKCDMVLAVWNGKPDVVGSTMMYARKQKKPVIMIDPFDLPE
jgi:uncharacterized phage-like protein YoqJ